MRALLLLTQKKEIMSDLEQLKSLDLSAPQIKLLLRALSDREDKLDNRFFGNKDHPKYASYERALDRIDKVEQILFNSLKG